MTVAEPEMVYGRGRAMQGCLMQYIVPKKDRSFLEDMARVRGWKSVEENTPRRKTSNHVPNACTVRAMKDALEGRVHHAKNVEDLFKQVEKRRSASPKKKLSGLEKAIQEVERGEVWEYDSVDDMFDQILGKGWRTK